MGRIQSELLGAVQSVGGAVAGIKATAEAKKKSAEQEEREKRSLAWHEELQQIRRTNFEQQQQDRLERQESAQMAARETFDSMIADKPEEEKKKLTDEVGKLAEEMVGRGESGLLATTHAYQQMTKNYRIAAEQRQAAIAEREKQAKIFLTEEKAREKKLKNDKAEAKLKKSIPSANNAQAAIAPGPIQEEHAINQAEADSSLSAQSRQDFGMAMQEQKDELLSQAKQVETVVAEPVEVKEPEKTKPENEIPTELIHDSTADETNEAEEQEKREINKKYGISEDLSEYEKDKQRSEAFEKDFSKYAEQQGFDWNRYTELEKYLLQDSREQFTKPGDLHYNLNEGFTAWEKFKKTDPEYLAKSKEYDELEKRRIQLIYEHRYKSWADNLEHRDRNKEVTNYSEYLDAQTNIYYDVLVELGYSKEEAAQMTYEPSASDDEILDNIEKSQAYIDRQNAIESQYRPRLLKQITDKLPNSKKLVEDNKDKMEEKDFKKLNKILDTDISNLSVQELIDYMNYANEYLKYAIQTKGGMKVKKPKKSARLNAKLTEEKK